MGNIPQDEKEQIELPKRGECSECGAERVLVAFNDNRTWNFSKECPQAHEQIGIQWWPFDENDYVTADELKELGFHIA